MAFRVFFFLWLLGSAFWFSACMRTEPFYEGNDLPLVFSTDTLRFDTVFTTQGSATRIFKVFNTRDEAIRIPEIRLAGHAPGFFRLNVDGKPGDVFHDVEILAKDSIYVFVEVTIDPDQDVSVSPFVVQEHVLFESSGQSLAVVLEAWGQNANYIPNNQNAGGIARLTCNMGEVIWSDPKPYVIFGVLLIDSCVLRIREGMRIHVHGGIVNSGNGFYSDGLIYTQPDGRLLVEGTPEHPVIFRSDRLESGFNEVPGQWAGIRLGPGSGAHTISHARILHPVVGILVDSSTSLTIRNTEIAYTASSGLSSFAGNISGDNLLLHANGRNGIQLSLGGAHRFRYCTLANYGNTHEALYASNIFCLDPLCTEAYTLPLNLEMINCVITGNQKDEITFIDGIQSGPSGFYFDLDHCLVRIDDLLQPDQWPDFRDYCRQCLEVSPNDRLFRAPDEGDFRPDSLAVFLGGALPLPDVPGDLVGNPRDPVAPDIGCYEGE